MVRRSRILWMFAVAVGLAGVAVAVFKVGDTPSEGNGASPAGKAPERLTLDAAVARIAAESQDGIEEPAVQAAPRLAGVPPVSASSAIPAPIPPDGYSFVTVHGPMAKARLEPPAEDGPPASEDANLHWLDAPDAIDTLVRHADVAGRDWSFGWVRLAEGASSDGLRGALERHGVVVLGAAGALVRAKLPGDATRLEAIAALPQVTGLGAVPRTAKLPAAFAEEALTAPLHEEAPVFVTLMTDDADGLWRRALEDAGATVGRFDSDIRVYAANVPYGALDAIAALDVVLAVEPVGVVRAAHDTAVPAMGGDALRVYSGSPGLFSGIGGASVPIAVMDTGLNINHLDIVSHRKSICGANFVYYDPRIDDADLWIDDGLHGTHVTGTIAGNGAAEPRYAGMAPSVGHIRFAKVLSHRGFGAGDSILRGMDFLAQPTGCPEAGWSDDEVKPLIVNMSLGASARVFEGRGTSERKLDSIVWSHRQLYVVAQMNANIHGFSDYGAAKNSLAVGAAMDSGEIASFSSHGPTADGRLAPQVVATGVSIYSAKGGGSRGEYVLKSGTSMASPATAGVAALLMDAVPAHKEQPALTRARLMASAVRPDAWLDNPQAFPSNNTDGPGALQAQYGLGKVSARTSVLNRDATDGWISGSAVSELKDGEYAWQEIVVPEGAGRLDLVMTWDEPPTDTIASAVLNDLDLWLDKDGNCGAGACGEYSSRSRKDNVEWIIVRNPTPGVYRAKVVARRIYTAAPRAALAWTVIRGASTPTLDLEADQEILVGKGSHELTLTLTADAYVAAGTRLHVDCRAAEGSSDCDELSISASDATREDSILHDPPGGTPGSSIALGEIAAGEAQEVEFEVSFYGDDFNAARLYFKASAWNAQSASVSVGVRWEEADLSEVPEAVRPANDDFAATAAIEGGAGSAELDLLLATPEVGEPVFRPWSGRPAGSAWYAWTAPSNGPIRFGVSSEETKNVNVEAFQGDRIAGLEQIATNTWSASFFAEAGQSYRIRVSNTGETAPLVLHWSSGPRPANDDFLAATVLEGEQGSVEGGNQGATLEPGELFGPLAATTWHRWTAPSDGAWEFKSSADGLRVLAFVGASLPDLRLMSGYPDGPAVFPARGEQEYRIAVAARDAFSAGSAYELTWAMTERDDAGNDDFAGAEELESVPSTARRIALDGEATVQPGEPAASGVRTKWWTWTAPEDGAYTWRLTDTPFTELLVTAFAGEALEDLKVVAATGPDITSTEFVLPATAGQRYSIAVGLPTGDLGAFRWTVASANLLWGPTPENDSLASAAPLTGAAGSVRGSNRFATAEHGERAGRLGHSSLWWTYEAPAAGWYRFWIDAGDSLALAAYREGGSGFGGLDLVRTSLGRGSDAMEVFFQAQAGERIALRLGTRGDAEGGVFTLRWEEVEAPVWLRYVGRLADGGQDASGEPVELRNPRSMAFNGRGTALYAASELGLQVFERDPETGGLALAQTLSDDGLRWHSLFWDSHRKKLYAIRYGGREFSPLDGTHLKLQDEGELSIVDGKFHADSAFMDSSGSFLYRVNRWVGIEALAFEASDLKHVQAVEINNLRDALISNDDRHVYAVTDSSLITFERDAETGELARTETDVDLSEAEAVAISGDDRHLFVIEEDEPTSVFQLEDDPANPRLLHALPRFGPDRSRWSHWNQCRFARSRNGTPAIDVFCHSSAFSVRWRPETGELVGTDYVAHWQADRFDNQIPDFGNSRGMATSPDGKHVYLTTSESGIVIFERVGNQLVDVDVVDADGYVRLYMLQVSAGKVVFGPLSSRGCIALDGTAIDGVVYTVESSKWQQRTDEDAEWADIADTQTTSQLCAHLPADPGQYRLVAEIAIDGEIGKYVSNVVSDDDTVPVENRPPRTVGSIDDQALTVGGHTATVDVAAAFSDPDGDVLAFEAESSNEAVVAPDVSGSDVILAPATEGEAEIAVTARDPGGLVAEQTFVVTVSAEKETTYCRPEDVVEPGQSCSIYSTSARFEVRSGGTGCVGGGGLDLCAGSGITMRNSSYTIVASRNDGSDNWTIEEVEPEPPG